MLCRVRAIQPRKGLDRLDPGEHLVHVHRVQQRLVEPRLKFLGDDRKTIRVFLEPVWNRRAGEPVHLRFVHFRFTAKVVLAGKRHDGPVRTLASLRYSSKATLYCMARSMPLATTIARAWPPIFRLAITWS